jgi:hypothetical protein
MVIRFFNHGEGPGVRGAHGLHSLSGGALLLVLSYSDGMQIKLWDWDKGWLNTQIFQVHAHYVMMCRVIVSGVAVHVIYIIQIYNWAFTIHKVRGRGRLVLIYPSSDFKPSTNKQQTTNTY